MWIIIAGSLLFNQAPEPVGVVGTQRECMTIIKQAKKENSHYQWRCVSKREYESKYE